MKSQLSGKNKIKAANTWALSLLRYWAGTIKWNKEELQAIESRKKSRQSIGELHPRSDVSRIYVPRKNKGRGLGPVSRTPGNFSSPISYSKISNLTITELLYWQIFNMKRSSLHTRSFRCIHFFVFRYRWTEIGFRYVIRYVKWLLVRYCSGLQLISDSFLRLKGLPWAV